MQYEDTRTLGFSGITGSSAFHWSAGTYLLMRDGCQGFNLVEYSSLPCNPMFKVLYSLEEINPTIPCFYSLAKWRSFSVAVCWEQLFSSLFL